MTIKKRLAAMGAAVMMMVSMAAINASAYTAYYDVSSTSPKSYEGFSAGTAGEYTVRVDIEDQTVGNALITCDGYIKKGTTWYYIVQATANGEGHYGSKKGTWYQINKYDPGRNTISVNYGKSTGTTTGK